MYVVCVYICMYVCLEILIKDYGIRKKKNCDILRICM